MLSFFFLKPDAEHKHCLIGCICIAISFIVCFLREVYCESSNTVSFSLYGERVDSTENKKVKRKRMLLPTPIKPGRRQMPRKMQSGFVFFLFF